MKKFDPYPRMNARTLKALSKRLLPLGGDGVVDLAEPDIKAILKRGRAFDTKGIKYRKGEPRNCHGNAAMLWFKDDHILVSGYYLTDADGPWRQHSWCVRKSNGAIIETTIKAVAYFGAELTEKESLKRFFSEWGWKNPESFPWTERTHEIARRVIPEILADAAAVA